MNPAIISLLSGPLMALARYAIAAGATYVTQRQWVDGNTVAAGAAALTGIVSAALGALTSTKSVAIAKVADIEGASVKLPNGRTVQSKEQAASVIGADPTWDNPNAR